VIPLTLDRKALQDGPKTVVYYYYYYPSTGLW